MTASRKTIETRIALLIGPGAASLLGLSTGFFCYVMPAAVIGRVFDPAAIGGQGVLAGIAAIVVGGTTWAGFARFDHPKEVRYITMASAAREDEALPVLRRADAHPDAPARRPIFAGSDLGTPLDLIDPAPAKAVDTIALTPQPTALIAAIARGEGMAGPAKDIEIDPSSSPEPVLTFALEAAVSQTASATTTVMPVIDTAEPVLPLQVMMKRLETGLARKSLVLAGAEPNVTALRREIRPFGGSLVEAVEVLQQRTASSR